ncbi:hypothetical protein TRFO_21071 [Tritrichomonas foetus]|uniref:Uncharacterized protein n=1 Tax=Tritrichomonas foetus TaxID=1144522 RepID=A0A1J4KFI8_9EUKA|nr:hypothetical protein TRFO_21071 [Tritrichomonas foetus]|eukprot:OHT09963.1 hypothetical protein TRFO_21071 [Tritrichomonas foetus]
MEHNRPYPIFLYYYHKTVKKIIIRKTMQVKALRLLIHDLSPHLCYKGSFINEELTFENYCIVANDIIISLAPTQGTNIQNNESLNRQLICLSTNKYEFIMKMKNILLPKNSQESLRLRDIRLMKYENRKKGFLSMQKHVFKENTPSLNRKQKPTIICEKLSEPSNEPLPIFWEPTENSNLLRVSSTNLNEK